MVLFVLFFFPRRQTLSTLNAGSTLYFCFPLPSLSLRNAYMHCHLLCQETTAFKSKKSNRRQSCDSSPFFFPLLHRYRSQHRRGFQRSVAVHTRTNNFFFLFYTLIYLLFFFFDSLLAFLLDSSIFFFFFFLPLKVLDRNRTTRQALSQLRFFVECLSCSGSLFPFYACLKLLLEKRTASNAVLHLHS